MVEMTVDRGNSDREIYDSCADTYKWLGYRVISLFIVSKKIEGKCMRVKIRSVIKKL